MLSTLTWGQGIQVSAGDSTLFNAAGAQLKMTFNNSETDAGAGVVNGHVYGGLVESFKYDELNVCTGDVQMPFQLRTDFVENVMIFPAAGLRLSKGDSSTSNTYTFFVGETAQSFVEPYFFGSKLASPTAGLFFTHRWGTYTFDSAEVFSNRQSAIETVSRSFNLLKFSVAAGLGSNSPFAAFRAGYKDSHWSGVLNYTKRGINFRRIVMPYMTYTENSGLNVMGGFASAHFNASADRTNNVSQTVGGTIVNSIVNSINASENVSLFSLNGSSFFGQSAGKPVSGQTVGAGMKISFLSVHADVYNSTYGLNKSVTFTEKLSPQYSLNEFVQGHDLNFGGEFRSNRATIAAGYSMSYFPVLDRFEKILSAQITIQLPYALTLTGGTLTTPDGHTRYTVFGNKYSQGPLRDVSLGSGGNISTGKWKFSGTVVDEDGKPVVGVAVQIGKVYLYSNMRGDLVSYSHKNKPQAVTVLTNEFMAPGKWVVVTAPVNISPEAPFQIIVRKVTS